MSEADEDGAMEEIEVLRPKRKRREKDFVAIRRRWKWDATG